jgi:ankyrin repeat protein
MQRPPILPADMTYNLLYDLIARGQLENAKPFIEDHLNAAGSPDPLLFHALSHKQFNCAEFLLSKGANINHCIIDVVLDKKTILHHFIDNNIASDEMSKIKWLLEHQADPNICSRDLCVPLIDACESPEITELLCDYGANPNIRDSSGDTSLTDCIFEAEFEDENFIFNKMAQLIAAGANVNSQGKNGNTALHMAAKHASYSIVPLLHYGASRDALNNNNETPLDLATDSTAQQLLNASPLPALPDDFLKALAKINQKKVKLL